MNRDFVGLR